MLLCGLGGKLSFWAVTTLLCADQSENIPAWLLSLSVSVRHVCRLGSGADTEGKPSLSWQRWDDIHGWMKPHKLSPSIKNHDWFQGHKLLQPGVWKKWSSTCQVAWNWSTTSETFKDKRSNISTCSTSQDTKTSWAYIAINTIFFILSMRSLRTV